MPALLVFPLLMPTKIKPTCAIDEKARNRLIFCCRMANKLPMTMVAMASITSMVYQTILHWLKDFVQNGYKI